MDEQAIIGVVSGIIIALGKYVYDVIKQRKSASRRVGMNNTLTAHANITQAMNTLLNSTPFERVVLLRAHNGGKVPQIGCTLRSSVFGEVFGKLPSARLKWQAEILEESYVDMLINLCRRKFVNVDVRTMPQGTLKNMYVAQGVVTSRVVFVHQRDDDGRDGALWYLSLNADREVSLTGADLNSIRECVSSISRILST